MPERLPRPCAICRRTLVRDRSRCPSCEAARARSRPAKPKKTYPSAAARGYSSAWKRARLGYLRKHPFCERCLGFNREVRATELDHIRPHGGDRGVFWDRDNWHGLCKPCHARKTLAETRAAGKLSGANHGRQ